MPSEFVQVEILTPSAVIYRGKCSYVQLPLEDGLVGILPGHTPMISLLGYGLLSLRDNGQSQEHYVVDGGFVEVSAQSVYVLANHSEPLHGVDMEKAKQSFETAWKRQPRGDEEIQERLQQLSAARVRLRHGKR